MTLKSLGLRNTARRRGRSLGVVGVLACGCFLVFSVAANKKNPLDHAEERGSGTGGFALIGESSLPIFHDLNTPEGRNALGLDREVLKEVTMISIRVRDGDDASCLNLNRSQSPRFLGLSPESMEGAFSFLHTAEGFESDNPWSLLNAELPGGTIPVVADQGTILWGLSKKVGDILDVRDEAGKTFKIRLMGAFKNSVLHGNLIMSEQSFIRCFPTEAGYRMFLVDAPLEAGEELAQTFARAGRNRGLEMTATVDRLAAFLAVENTYLSIFQALGGLGLLLGSVGLGFVLYRNVLERQGELALLQAVGYTRKALFRMLLYEHLWLLAAGLVCGVVAAGVAVWPAIESMGTDLPWLSQGLTLLSIMAGGIVWILSATRLAMARPLMDALRNE